VNTITVQIIGITISIVLSATSIQQVVRLLPNVKYDA